MSVFDMVVAIVVIGCITGVINNVIKRKNSGNSDDMEELMDRMDAVETLEERVRVLEAVITDQNYELKQQFQDLEKE